MSLSTVLPLLEDSLGLGPGLAPALVASDSDGSSKLETDLNELAASNCPAGTRYLT